MKKGILIIIGYLVIGFTVSCCEEVTHPFFDFKSISVDAEPLENESKSEVIGTVFAIGLEEQLLHSQTQFNLFNSAYALSQCPTNGNQGLKYNLVDLNIITNQIFFDSIPVGEDISHLFYAKNYNDSIVTIEELLETQGLTGYYGGETSLLPSLFLLKNNLEGTEHVFEFSIKKSNGEVISGSSEPIIWN